MKGMRNMEKRLIYLTGSEKTIERVLWQDDDGKFWIKWCGEKVRVYHPMGFVNVTNGWRTVEDY